MGFPPYIKFTYLKAPLHFFPQGVEGYSSPMSQWNKVNIEMWLDFNTMQRQLSWYKCVNPSFPNINLYNSWWHPKNCKSLLTISTSSMANPQNTFLTYSSSLPPMLWPIINYCLPEWPYFSYLHTILLWHRECDYYPELLVMLLSTLD